jgi:tRNA nucleotidyltransferase/poly(A) polymerase
MNLIDAAQEVATYLDEVSSMGALRHFLMEHFREAHSILIVGGALRDLFLTPRKTPKDIDVVLEGIEPRNAYEISGADRNFFGGITITYEGFSVDLWRLEDTYHLKQFPLPCSVSGFLEGAPFNLDKIAYDILTDQLYDNGCLAGIRQHEIRYVPAWPYLEPIQAARAILLHWKTNFSFHDSTEQLLERSNIIIEKDPTEVVNIKDYLRHLKKFFPKQMVEHVLEEIRQFSKEVA